MRTKEKEKNGTAAKGNQNGEVKEPSPESKALARKLARFLKKHPHGQTKPGGIAYDINKICAQ